MSTKSIPGWKFEIFQGLKLQNEILSNSTSLQVEDERQGSSTLYNNNHERKLGKSREERIIASFVRTVVRLEVPYWVRICSSIGENHAAFAIHMDWNFTNI